MSNGNSSTTGAGGSSSSGQDEELATLLRTHTRTQHNASDKLIHLVSPFILSSPRIYRLLLKSFYHVFKVMEEEIEQRRLQYPKIAPIYFRELRRTTAFEHDLSYFYNDDPENRAPAPSAATAAYIADMRKAIHEDPVVLIAYSQTFYMGLLSGGLVLRRWITKAFQLTPPAGVAIFDFTHSVSSDVTSLKQGYTDAINSIALTHAQKARLVQQKKKIFESNNQLIKEVCWSSAYRHRLLSLLLKILVVLAVAWLVWTLFISKQ